MNIYIIDIYIIIYTYRDPVKLEKFICSECDVSLYKKKKKKKGFVLFDTGIVNILFFEIICKLNVNFKAGFWNWRSWYSGFHHL